MEEIREKGKGEGEGERVGERKDEQERGSPGRSILVEDRRGLLQCLRERALDTTGIQNVSLQNQREKEDEGTEENKRKQKEMQKVVDDLDTSSLKTGNSVTYFNIVITCAPGGINPKFTLNTSEFSVIKQEKR